MFYYLFVKQNSELFFLHSKLVSKDLLEKVINEQNLTNADCIVFKGTEIKLYTTIIEKENEND